MTSKWVLMGMGIASLLADGPFVSADPFSPKSSLNSSRQGHDMRTEIKELVHLKDLTKDAIEKKLGISLQRDDKNSDAVFDHFAIDPPSKKYQKVSLRFPKSRGGVQLVVKPAPNSVSMKDIFLDFGPPDREMILEPEGATKITYHLSGRTVELVFSKANGLVKVTVIDGR